MTYCSEDTLTWIKFRAMGYLISFLKNHKKNIYDEDVFAPLNEAVPHDEFSKLFRKHFSAAERRKITGILKEDEDYLNLKGEYEDVFQKIWQAVPALRPKVISFAEVISTLAESRASEVEKNPHPKWKEFVELINLSPLEENILLIARCVEKDILCEICESGRSNAEDAIDFIAKCLNLPKGQIAEAVSENTPLRRYDCVDSDVDFCHHLEDFFSGLSKDPLTSRFFTKVQKESLPWEFYGELAEKHGELLKKLISSGKSVNILLYGVPGAGKTSFAHSLAAELGFTCYSVAQSNARGGGDYASSDSSTNFRFAALQICANLVPRKNTLLVVDEADAMLQGSSSFFNGANEKGRLNDALDSITVPVIWITNAPADALDESSRRRFDYSVRFDRLSAAQRQMIWKNSVAKMKLKKYFTEEMLCEFAEKYPVSAGGINIVLKNLAILKPGREEVKPLMEKLLATHCELLDVPSQEDDKLLPAKDYSLEGLNIKGDIQLGMIVGAVRKFLNSSASASPDRPRMNLLLAGPPGTGKTEFVKYLGKELGRKIIVCMGSDLLDMYVGGTEQKIKAAFERAEREKAILFLDEIDGLMQNRERSNHSWEVTQVNELLYRMENFNGVMIGATNFFKNLDPAVMRRFTFKLDFSYLDNDGKKIFFERMFKTGLTEAELAQLNAISNLAPGDFRTVRQALYYLENDSNALRLEALAKESAAKTALTGGKNGGKFGF